MSLLLWELLLCSLSSIFLYFTFTVAQGSNSSNCLWSLESSTAGTSAPTQHPEAAGTQQETHLPSTLSPPTRNLASPLLPALTSSSKPLLLLIPPPIRMSNSRGLLTVQDSQMSVVSTCGFDIHGLAIAKEYGKYCRSKVGGRPLLGKVLPFPSLKPTFTMNNGLPNSKF